MDFPLVDKVGMFRISIGMEIECVDKFLQLVRLSFPYFITARIQISNLGFTMDIDDTSIFNSQMKTLFIRVCILCGCIVAYSVKNAIPFFSFFYYFSRMKGSSLTVLTIGFQTFPAV